MDSSLYVDDFVIFAKSSILRSAKLRIQLVINKATKWAIDHWFNLSQKTVVHFTYVRGAFPPLTLAINNLTISVVTQNPRLSSWGWSLTKNSHGSFIYLRSKCLKLMDLLKSLSHVSWDADRMTLLRVYRALVRSQLDYGSSSLKMLDLMKPRGASF